MNKRFLLVAFSISLFLVCWTSYSFLLDVPYSAKRLAEGFLLVLGAGIVSSSTVVQEKYLAILTELKSTRILGVLLLLFVLGLLSSSLANYPKYGFLQLGHYFLLFNLMIVSVIGYRFKPVFFEYGFLSIIGLMAGLYLFNVAVSYLYTFFIPDFPMWPSTDFTRIWIEGSGFKYPKPFSNFVNIRFFNHLQTWTLPLLTLLVLYIPKRYWAFSKIVFVVLCGWWMLAFASDARGTLLASVIAFIFILLMYRKKAKQWLKTYTLSAIAGLIFYGLFFKLFKSSNATGGRTALSNYDAGGRLELWENIIQLILQNPLFGLGPLHYPPLGNEVVKAPHNIYLQFTVEWGFLAGLLFVALIAAGFYYWVVNTNKDIDSLAPDSSAVNVRVALTASLLAALIHGFTSNIFNSPLSQIMMVLVVGWMIGLSVSDEYNEENISNGLWKRAGLIGINLLAAGFLIWSYAAQVPDLDKNRQKYIQITNENRLTPRYWDQGVIGLENYNQELNEQSASE